MIGVAGPNDDMAGDVSNRNRCVSKADHLGGSALCPWANRSTY